MRCSDDAVLWQAAEGRVDAQARETLDAHLAGCEACAGRLLAVQSTRQVLRQAAAAAPTVDWQRADDQVLTAAAERFARRSRFSLPTFFRSGLAFAAAALAVAGGLWLWTADRPVRSKVESAQHAHVTEVSSTEETLEMGDGLGEGARVRTTATGQAVLRLPDQSRALLGPRSTVTVQRARPDDVALRLEDGDLVVEAAHVARAGFVVEAGLAQVHVVGTVFRVSRTAEGVEVSVAQGRVRVEPRHGEARFVDAGERGVLDAQGHWQQRLGLSAQPKAASPSPAAPAVAAGAPERISLREVRPRPAAGGVAPSAVAPPAPSPVADPPAPFDGEWDTPEFKTREDGLAARTPGLAERARASGLPVSAEGLFLQRAEESLRSGRCAAYLVGLSDVLEVSEDVHARERARILRARCYDERLLPLEAEQEYRKYLSEFPRGRFAEEARRAVERG
jgi:hypothetical protein